MSAEAKGKALFRQTEANFNRLFVEPLRDRIIADFMRQFENRLFSMIEHDVMCHGYRPFERWPVAPCEHELHREEDGWLYPVEQF